MSIAIETTIKESEGFRRRLLLKLVGESEVINQVRGVNFDLGPTFAERLRQATKLMDGWSVEVLAYGSFQVAVSADLEGKTIEFTQFIELPRLKSVSAQPEVAGPKRWIFLRRIPSVAPWGSVALELLVAIVLFLFVYVGINAWPDGSTTIRLVGGMLHFSVTTSQRILLLAIVSGGLGALVQTASSLFRNPETGTLTIPWVRWYLISPIPGMALATIVYLIFRSFFFSPAAPAEAIAPWGVIVIGLFAGFRSDAVRENLQEVFQRLFDPFLSDPVSLMEENTMSSSPRFAADVPKSREDQRRIDISDAMEALRGKALSPTDAYKLAERLKDVNEFGYARRLFAQIRAKGDYRGLSKTPVKVGQRHALCTYKDPDLPASDRFKRALEILDEVDLLEMSPQEKEGATPEEISARQESLGLRGAVHKRRWQVEGNRTDLERSFGYYYRGYGLGPEHDQGYTGINAAFVLDLLARENAGDIAHTGTEWVVVREQWQQAQDIRRRLAKLLPELLKNPDNGWLKNEWWFYTTRAEAHFGLGEYEEALAALREYNTIVGLAHTGPPLEKQPPWEFETTLTQLASLAQLQADLAGLLEDKPNWKGSWLYPSTELRKRAEQTLRDYLGQMAPGAERAFTGKIGLALSGGGFRASLFHLGVLAYLAERDVLRKVEVLSCVSGGSIIGAHYYLEVKHLLQQKADHQIKREDFVELVQRLERDFLAGVETNVRCRVFGGFWANLRAFFQPGYTPTRRLGEMYETELYSRVQDGRGNEPRYIKDLFVHPKGEDPNFKPKYDNWRRGSKIPTLVLNSTTMNTGHNWQFTASWMGEPPSSLDAEIEGNYRLRRMYHWEAPRLKDKWHNRLFRPFAPPDYQRFRLGDAVASSSAVPGLFEPLVLPDLYEGKTLRLADGGVYDNQGTASLLEQDCTFMIVSDASGQMEAQDHPSGGRLGVPLRSFSVSMARVRQSEYQELHARLKSGLLKGLVFLHLKKDLDADPIDWRECQDPHDASDEARPTSRRGVLTYYGLQKGVQQLLSAIRTDLDSFTEVEAFSLMTSGYRMAQGSHAELGSFPEGSPPPGGWRFLKVEPLLKPGPGFDEITKHLRIAHKNAGKVWYLWRPLTVLAGALVASMFYAIVSLWYYLQDRVLFTVRGLGIFAIVLGASVLVPGLVRIVRYRQNLRDIGFRFLVAAVLAVGFKLHLLLFDPLFLRLGRVSRFIKMRQGSD